MKFIFLLLILSPLSHATENFLTCANAKTEIARLSEISQRTPAETERLKRAIRIISGCWFIR